MENSNMALASIRSEQLRLQTDSDSNCRYIELYYLNFIEKLFDIVCLKGSRSAIKQLKNKGGPKRK